MKFLQPAKFHRLRIFATWEISQVANFHNLRNFVVLRNCLSFCHCSSFLRIVHLPAPFYFLTFFVTFWISSYFASIVILIAFVILVILYWVLSIKDPRHDIVKGPPFCSLIKLVGGKLSALPALFYFPSFSLTFWATKHPMRMTTQRMVG